MKAPVPYTVEAFLRVRPQSASSWGMAFKHGYANARIPAYEAGVKAGPRGSTMRNAFKAGQLARKEEVDNEKDC